MMSDEVEKRTSESIQLDNFVYTGGTIICFDVESGYNKLRDG